MASLGPEGVPVSGGVFNLFAPTAATDARKMLYALPFYGLDGQPYLLDGFKDVRDHGSFDVWEANTTLYTVIREGHSRQGAVRATGILRIDLVHVLQMVASMQVTGSTSRHRARRDARALQRQLLRNPVAGLRDSRSCPRCRGVLREKKSLGPDLLCARSVRGGLAAVKNPRSR